MEWMALCAFSLEGIVKRELISLGFADARCGQGCVRFQSDWQGGFLANLWLRTADRVMLVVGEGRPKTFEELFQLVKSCPWGRLLPKNAAFPVRGKCVRSTLMSVRDCQAITKKAIAEAMKQKYGQSWFPEDGPKYQVECALHGDNALILLDASGDALNKRGYRTWNGEAPIREALAAALLTLSPWRPSDEEACLADPCCGTGTFLVEAAFMQSDRAPGLTRSFDMENWALPPEQKSAFGQIRAEARSRFRPERIHDLYGSDISGDALALCRRHFKQAGIQDRVRVRQADLKDLQMDPGDKRLFWIANPPYGERMSDQKNVESLYRCMRQLKDRHPGSRMSVITSSPSFERCFGQRALKKYRFYNARLECEYLIF